MVRSGLSLGEAFGTNHTLYLYVIQRRGWKNFGPHLIFRYFLWDSPPLIPDWKHPCRVYCIFNEIKFISLELIPLIYSPAVSSHSDKWDFSWSSDKSSDTSCAHTKSSFSKKVRRCTICTTTNTNVCRDLFTYKLGGGGGIYSQTTSAIYLVHKVGHILWLWLWNWNTSKWQPINAG